MQISCFVQELSLLWQFTNNNSTIHNFFEIIIQHWKESMVHDPVE